MQIKSAGNAAIPIDAQLNRAPVGRVNLTDLRL